MFGKKLLSLSLCPQGDSFEFGSKVFDLFSKRGSSSLLKKNMLICLSEVLTLFIQRGIQIVFGQEACCHYTEPKEELQYK